MGQRSEYRPGTFCWVDLATTDQEGAKAFYSGLLGWQASDMPIGDGNTYSMMTVGDRDVAAIAPQPPQQREAGVPSMWNNYVSVESADAAAQRAQELGANVHAPPFDVLDAGRMAVIQDPQGAFFMVWEPRRHFGAGLVNAPGALVWNELASPDPAASASFYGDLFGWTTSQFENAEDVYLAIRNGEASNGGITTLRGPAPPHWLPYFGVEDIDTGLARVEQLGGTRHAGPIDIEMAKIGIAQDPQGATFALYSGRVDP